ncbi:hypothetical protein ACSDR0_43385 [Streptosporangium sp. G11]|uniref:hypothetical protein n=1 Tax=Streptosporangium sp. G11 TaxID=3436926 RepID=UPI003EBC36C3
MTATYTRILGGGPIELPISPCPAWCDMARPGFDHSPNHSHLVTWIADGDGEGAAKMAAEVAVVQQPGRAPMVWLSAALFPVELVNGQIIELAPREAVILGRTLIGVHGTSCIGRALIEAAELIVPGAEQAVDVEAGVA